MHGLDLSAVTERRDADRLLKDKIPVRVCACFSTVLGCFAQDVGVRQFVLQNLTPVTGEGKKWRWRLGLDNILVS